MQRAHIFFSLSLSLSLFLFLFHFSLFFKMSQLRKPSTNNVLYPTAPFYSAADFIILLNGRELKPSYPIDDDVSFIRYNCVLSFLSFLTFPSVFFSRGLFCLVIFYILFCLRSYV